MPVCQLCNTEFKCINNYHLKRKHNLTPYEYDVMFPGRERYGSEVRRNMSSNSRKYTIDHNTLDHWNEETAWVIGLLTSDGTIGSNSHPHEFKVYSTDKEMLEEIQRVFRSDRPLYLSPKGNGHLGKKDVYQMAVSSPRICQHLKIIDCYGPKDERNPFKHIPEYYKWSFIKGLIDGDGNFYKAHGTLSLAGRRQLITEVYNWICDQLNKEPNKIYNCSNTDKTVYVQFGKEDSYTIYHLIKHHAEVTYDSKKFINWSGYYKVIL